MKKFNDFEISHKIKTNITKMGYKEPTDVQSQAIPAILNGKDVLVSSQTGTGKTGAFLIPILTVLSDNRDKQALVVAPTRELAKQVWTVANEMMGSNKKTALLIGGDSMPKQIAQLKQKPCLIVGTPGRINDHLSKRKSLKLDTTHYLILDETDRMLDMGFGIQIDEIIKFMAPQRQTILFSATLPKGITEVANKYLTNPIRIISGEENSIADKIEQKVVKTEDRFEKLLNIFDEVDGSVVVFARTQRNVEKLSDKLHKLEGFYHKVGYLHGGLRQNKREKVMKNFRNSKFKILIATDVASRGLDVPHIDCVVNYDLPDSPEDYIHRIGRTARAEKTGTSIALISKKDLSKWAAIQRFLKGVEEPSSNKSSKKKKKSSNNTSRKTEKKSYSKNNVDKYSKKKPTRNNEETVKNKDSKSKYGKKKFTKDSDFEKKTDKSFSKNKSNKSKSYGKKNEKTFSKDKKTNGNFIKKFSKKTLKK